jgi:hypothetical protein
MKITLKDLTCITLLSSSTTTVIDSLRRRCILETPTTLQRSPLHMIQFILAETSEILESWLESQWTRILLLEDSTWMTPRHQFSRADVPLNTQAKGLTMLLRELHAVNKESRIALTVAWAAVSLSEDLKALVGEVNALRAGIGAEEMKPGYRAQLEDRVRYTETVLTNMAEKKRQLLDRINAQINLVGWVLFFSCFMWGFERNKFIAKLRRSKMDGMVQWWWISYLDPHLSRLGIIPYLLFLGHKSEYLPSSIANTNSPPLGIQLHSAKRQRTKLPHRPAHCR